MKANAGNKGFTLLEMTVALVILAITASMAVPQFQQSINKRRADNAISTLRKISYCIRIYKQERGGVLPAGKTFAELDTGTGNGCLDRAQFEKTYTFPLATDLMSDAAGVIAQDNKSSRMVCVKPAGTSDRSGIVYDFPSMGVGCDATRTDKYRSCQE